MDLTRLTDSGKLLRVRHGVYALPSAGADRLQDVRGAWLAASANGDVVVSGASAAVVHGLGDLVPAAHEFTAPVRRRSTLPDLRFRRADLSENDATVVDGIPVTTVVRTATDLAASLLDSDHLAGVLSAAVENLDVDVEELAQALSPFSKHYGFDSGRALLAEVAPGYGAAALSSAARAALRRSPQFRKQALKLLSKPDGAKTLRSILEKCFAS